MNSAMSHCYRSRRIPWRLRGPPKSILLPKKSYIHPQSSQSNWQKPKHERHYLWHSPGTGTPALDAALGQYTPSESWWVSVDCAQSQLRLSCEAGCQGRSPSSHSTELSLCLLQKKRKGKSHCDSVIQQVPEVTAYQMQSLLYVPSFPCKLPTVSPTLEITAFPMLCQNTWLFSIITQSIITAQSTVRWTVNTSGIKRPNIHHYNKHAHHSSTESKFTFTIAFQNALESWSIIISTQMQLLVNIFFQEAGLWAHVYLTLKVNRLVAGVLQSSVF